LGAIDSREGPAPGGCGSPDVEEERAASRTPRRSRAGRRHRRRPARARSVVGVAGQGRAGPGVDLERRGRQPGGRVGRRGWRPGGRVGRQGRQPGGTRAGEDGGRGGSIGDEAPVMAAGGCGGQAAGSGGRRVG
jgi:hypothetical protein